jgi:hypothetical protein
MPKLIAVALLVTAGLSAAACEKRERSSDQGKSLERKADKAADKAGDEAHKLKEKVDD